MYPNHGNFPNPQYTTPFGSNMAQAQASYPSIGMQMPQPMPMQVNYPQGPPNSGFQPQLYQYPQLVPNLALSQQQMYSQNIFPQQSATGMYPQMPNLQQLPQYPMQSPLPTQQNHQQSYGHQIPTQQHFTSFSHMSTTAGTLKKGRPTVVPLPNFDASNDAAILRKAMKGFGTDENAIIKVLCNRPNHQRIEIAKAYKTAYGKDLINDIKSETSGNFEKVLVALLTPTVEYYCQELNVSMAGAGTDEDVLVEVMCTMSNYEIKQIGVVYYRMYGRSLEETLRGDTSGNVKRLFTSLSVGGRDESMTINIESARADAQALKKAGVDRWGTDESEFNRILCLRNFEQLKIICEEYEKLTGNTLEKDIKKEFSGDIEDALLAIVRVASNRPQFFARRLHKAMAGLGTNDRSLIRLCVTRAEIDMQDIKEEFQRYYSKTLKSFIKGDTSGHYRNSLYALCGE